MPRTLPVAIAFLPEFGDHRIAGKAIVPAVYLLDQMVRAATDAGLVKQSPLTIRTASFPRFLPAEEIERCTFDLAAEIVDGNTRLQLSSRIALPSSIQRIREHAILTLGKEPIVAPPPEIIGGEFDVSAELLYRELIPFGPRYCNLRGSIRLGLAGALGTVRSPETGFTSSIAGCPYLFDGAMHLACVWGQRYAGVVAYPTGFASRTIVSPLSHGERVCVVAPRSQDARNLSFDLWLLDEHRRPCDVTLGLSMAPPATGTVPPGWIVHPDRQRSL